MEILPCGYWEKASVLDKRGVNYSESLFVENKKTKQIERGERGVAQRCNGAKTREDLRPLIDGDYNSQSLYIAVAQEGRANHLLKIVSRVRTPLAVL